MTPGAEIEPGPHWLKASALTTRLTVPPSRAPFRFRGQFESQFQNKPFLTILPFKMCFATL